MKLLYDAAARSCTAGCLLHFEDLMNQIRDMVAQQREPGTGFTAQELWESKLGAGVIGLLTNANNMLLQRSTAEWGRGAQGLQGQYRQPMTRPAIRRWHAWLFGFQGTNSHGNAEDENSAVWHAAAKAARHIQRTGAENASLVCVLEAYPTYAVMRVHPLHLCKPALVCPPTSLCGAACRGLPFVRRIGWLERVLPQSQLARWMRGRTDCPV